jgi:type I restriction enzyme, R subunit
VAIYDPVTGEVTNSAELEDELDFDIEIFNKQVINESFNKTFLEEIANYLNPDGEGKTLIYAVDNSHADLIVKLLKEKYEKYGVNNEAIKKITGSVGGGNRKKISEAKLNSMVKKLFEFIRGYLEGRLIGELFKLP